MASSRVEGVADHFQVLVGDKEQGPNVDTTSLWDGRSAVPCVEGFDELFAIPLRGFGGRVVVEIVVLESEPWQAQNPARLIGRFVLDVPSGEIVLWGPEAREISSQPHVQAGVGKFDGELYCYEGSHVEPGDFSQGDDSYHLVLRPRLHG